MTTCAQIETQWNTSIWNYTDILDITPNAYAFPATELSEREVRRFYYQSEINFFTYLVTPARQRAVTSSIEKFYNVDVTYYREQDPNGENWGEVRDAFETLHATVISQLGSKWNDLVDYWNTSPETLLIESEILDTRPVWRATYRFTAQKFN